LGIWMPMAEEYGATLIVAEVEQIFLEELAE
jgi:hypothetical protein